MIFDPKYSLTGLLVGILVGMTGMGGGSLMTPILIIIVGIKPTVAVGSDLAYSAITKMVGAWQHKKQGNVDVGLACRMAIGSVPASMLGVWTLHSIEKGYGALVQVVVVRTLGVMLILVGAIILARTTKLIKRFELPGYPKARRRTYKWPILLGAVLGFVVGITSVGSGTLFGVALLVLFAMDAREMVGTDIYHAAMLTTGASLAHVMARNVDYSLVANLLIGSIPGVLIGGRMVHKMPYTALRATLAVVLLLSGLKMVFPTTH